MLIRSEHCGVRELCVQGGRGICKMKDLATKDTMYQNARLFAEVTIPVGGSIGDHPHNNETEFYYILSGKGRFNDNGVYSDVGPGDLCSTGYGETHGLENIGSEELHMIALIVLEK